MAFKTINPGIWTYDKKNDSIEGIYKGFEAEVGAHKSNIYDLRTADGPIRVWGSAVLDQLMKYIEIGDKIKIIYKGTTPSDKGNPAKIFEVQQDDGSDDSEGNEEDEESEDSDDMDKLLD